MACTIQNYCVYQDLYPSEMVKKNNHNNMRKGVVVNHQLLALYKGLSLKWWRQKKR